MATRQFGCSGVDDGIGLEQRHHAVNVSGPLPVDQQTFQILRIARRFPARLIGHGKVPPSAMRRRH
ncbi:hypothetical protein [Mesorhizobium sp. LNJC394B00]|uniref:hypothetical protein n=1 Tax=Mesorhizobium sp. LNJC394B00 TaxID=1287274 RepID=UPI0003FCBF4A|nr:hypothetical protein [Mesorhizobium sp. LNJC394B00]